MGYEDEGDESYEVYEEMDEGDEMEQYARQNPPTLADVVHVIIMAAKATVAVNTLIRRIRG